MHALALPSIIKLYLIVVLVAVAIGLESITESASHNLAQYMVVSVPRLCNGTTRVLLTDYLILCKINGEAGIITNQLLVAVDELTHNLDGQLACCVIKLRVDTNGRE